MNHPGTDMALGGARLSVIKASMTGLNPDGRRPDAGRRIKKSSENLCGNNYSETKMRLVLTFIYVVYYFYSNLTRWPGFMI